MPKSGPRVVVLELNEITWDQMDPLLKKGALPNFQKLINEGVRGDAYALETGELLDPWVTWTTLYTGVPQEVHGVAMLEQDKETIKADRIWEILKARGVSIGLFGSATTWPPQQVDGFWVPGPFSQDYATYPKELEPIQELNVGFTRGHTVGAGKKPSLKTLIPKLMGMGLKISTVVRLGLETLAIKKNPSVAWKKVALQPVLNFDLFAQLYRTHQPQFATFHSNHVAYYQHRFWRAQSPEAFEVPPSAEEKSIYGGCIEHGYRVADELLGRLRQLVGPNTHIFVLGSCGQQPATGGRYSEDQRNGNLGLQIHVEKLIEAMGVKGKVEFSNLMAPQWKIDFTDPATLKDVLKHIQASHNTTRNCNVFSVSEQGMSL